LPRGAQRYPIIDLESVNPAPVETLTFAGSTVQRLVADEHQQRQHDREREPVVQAALQVQQMAQSRRDLFTPDDRAANTTGSVWLRIAPNETPGGR
jgi:hypothetical protein